MAGLVCAEPVGALGSSSSLIGGKIGAAGTHLVGSGKVPDDLLQKLPLSENEGYPDEPLFPTVEEQERAREIITGGWDAIVGVTLTCIPADDPASVPMSLLDDAAGPASQSPEGPRSGSNSQVAGAAPVESACGPI